MRLMFNCISRSKIIFFALLTIYLSAAQAAPGNGGGKKPRTPTPVPTATPAPAPTPTPTPPPPTLPGLSIEIISPTEGSEVASNVNVIGRYTSPDTHHGVVVKSFDGKLTQFAAVGAGSGTDRKFFASNVLLEPGSNTIEAVVSTLDGFAAAATVEVVASSYEPTLSLKTKGNMHNPFPVPLLSPATVEFLPKYWGSEPFVEVTVDYDGDGVVDEVYDYLPKTLKHRFENPGLYEVLLTARDGLNRESTAQYTVEVVDAATLYAQLPGIWDLLRDRLRVGDIDNALKCIRSKSREQYRQMIGRLANETPLSQINEVLTDITSVEASDRWIAFEYRRMEDGFGEIAYPAIFYRDRDGVWRLDDF